jgi:HAD superfamily hydrolase (TIGR01549 family)
MSNIKAILSDYDGVLIPDEYKGIKRLCPNEETIIKLEEPYYTQRDDTDLWSQMKKEFSLECSALEIINAYNFEDAFQERQSNIVLTIYKDLKMNGVRLLLLSNQVASRSRYIRNKSTLNIFDKIYLSSEVGMKKPNADIFLSVLSEQCLVPSEVVFIDDAIENIEQAKSLGLNTVLFNEVPAFKNELARISANG